MKQKPKSINQNSTLADLLKVKGAEKILAKYGVPCIYCPMAKFELDKLKIGEVCKIYQLPLKKILKDLNALLIL